MKIQIALARTVNLHGVHYDQIQGKGAIPYNQEIDHKGISVLMKPSTFLSLCYPLKKGQAEALNFDYLKQWIKEGNSIGSPWLRIELYETDEHDERGNRIRLAKGSYVSGHEGRNRALAIRELFGDVDMEVHITFNVDNNKALNTKMIEELNTGVKNQMGRFIDGPLWK